MKHLFTLLIAAGLLLNTASAQTVGQPAPDFMLKTLSNSDYTLSANKGKVILVYLVGYSCPLCIAAAPTVQSDLISAFSGNNNFEVVIIDTWNGSVSSFNTFKNRTMLTGIYLLMGGDVATSWTTTYDRLAVVDAEGKLVFKGTRAARSDINEAKSAIQTALQNVSTSVFDLEENSVVSLGQNYPNPAIGKTNIEFSIAASNFVTLKVTNLAGKEVASLINSELPAGKHLVQFDTDNLPNGIYFYRLDAGNNSATNKMIINK